MAAPVSCVPQDVPQGDLKVLWPQQTFHHFNIHCDLGAAFLLIFHCIHHPFFNCAPTDCQLFLDFSPPSITCRCRRILSPWRSFVCVPSRPFGHKETHVIRTEGFENLAPSLVSCFFQDSPEIHINIFWSQETFQFFNPRLHTTTNFFPKNCFVLAMIVLSLAILFLPLRNFPALPQRKCTNFAQV